MKPQFLQDEILFGPGMSQATHYRIPSLVTTEHGVVIAAIDARYDTSKDNPNRIDKAIRRSLDGGKTWEPVQVIVSCSGRGRDNGEAAIDPAMLVDRQTNTVWMIYCHTPGGVGLVASRPGRGCDDKGRRYVYDRQNTRYLLEDGALVSMDGTPTSVLVSQAGDVTVNGKACGNLYLGYGEYLVERTSYLEAVYSEDDGATWSAPIDLTHQVKEEWMRFIGAGPGIGIQLQQGPHAGRLIFPIYFSNETNSIFWRMSCALIYSDDHGKTWHRGASPNDGRVLDGETLSARTLQAQSGELTESQAVELENGKIRVYLRNHLESGCVAYCESTDGGESFSQVLPQPALPDPVCQSSVIRLPDLGDGVLRLLFANPADSQERIRGTVRLSEDGGKTWCASRTVDEGFFMYNSMTALPDGTVGILYEGDETEQTIRFRRFSLDWIRQGD